MIAVSEQPTLFAAGQVLCLSHSVISVHIKQLEEELEVELVDRSSRPLTMTDKGVALVDYAKQIMQLVDEIHTIRDQEDIVGTINIGVVPSVLIDLVPPALAALRAANPKLQIGISTGLSAALTQDVQNRNLDAAIVTEPDKSIEGVRKQLICHEPLFFLAPLDSPEESIPELLANHPFIWFNRRTWAGQQIERHLLKKRFPINSTMEVDSLEAIEALIANGMGVTIVPKRIGALPFENRFKVIEFESTPVYRNLILIDRSINPRSRTTNALHEELLKQVKKQDQG